MPWEPDELEDLRRSSLEHLLTTNKLGVEDQSKKVFTCDLCTKSEDCEWVFHHDNLSSRCLWEEFNGK